MPQIMELTRVLNFYKYLCVCEGKGGARHANNRKKKKKEEKEGRSPLAGTNSSEPQAHRSEAWGAPITTQAPAATDAAHHRRKLARRFLPEQFYSSQDATFFASVRPAQTTSGQAVTSTGYPPHQRTTTTQAPPPESLVVAGIRPTICPPE